jgi:hypothetical protein
MSPQNTDASGEMRSAGISSAGMDADLGGMEDQLEDGEAPVDGGAGEAPSTVTGDNIGPATTPSSDQTI